MKDSTAPNAVPRLETDILEITKLHELREAAYLLRNEGLRSLLNRALNTKKPLKEVEVFWAPQRDEPNDFVYPALMFMVASRRFARTNLPDLSRRAQKKYGRLLLEIGMEDIFHTRAPITPGGGRGSSIPIFQAARVCQALMSSADTIFSRAFWICYYRIIRELHSTNEPSWSIGGARIVEGARPSAFMTGECARVVSSLARSMHNTASQLKAIVSAFELVVEIENDALLPSEWKRLELERVLLSAYTTIHSLNARSILNIDEKHAEDLIDADAIPGANARCINFCEALSRHIRQSLGKAHNKLAEAREEIEIFHKRELEHTKKTDAVERLRIQLPHEIGLRAITAAQDAIELLQKSSRRLVATPRDLQSASVAFTAMVGILSKAADRTRRILSAAREYVNSILDREAEKEKTGIVDASELAFAAASVISLKRSPRDPRLAYALAHFEKQISLEGHFAHIDALDTDSRGYSFYIVGSEIIRAIAQLLEKIDREPSISFLECLLNYFDTKLVSLPDSGEVLGWHHDHPKYPKRALQWTSALAVLGLDRIGRMLDQRINSRVYSHFTVSRPGSNGGALTLNKVIAPDYGLTAFYQGLHKDAQLDEVPNESIVFYLERARAHALGVKSPDRYDSPCFSLVLYGPAGTGKTTLVHALAASSKLPLIEISPSDFLVEGEHFFERRAKAIFIALQALTDTIVLFDEMDEILRKRNDDPKNHKTDIYSLLRPGMLPKFAKMNESAKRQRVCYVLNTNFVGNMDVAAIRNKRFDFKLGVFPPDCLSRMGSVGKAVGASRYADDTVGAAVQAGKLELSAQAIFGGVDKMRGGNMPSLARPGVFLPVNAQSVPKNSILAAALPGKAAPFIAPVVEDRFNGVGLPEDDIAKMTPEEQRGHRRWLQVEVWDDLYNKVIESDNPDKWSTASLDAVVDKVFGHTLA